MIPGYSHLTLTPYGFSVKTPFELRYYEWIDVKEFRVELVSGGEGLTYKRVYFFMPLFGREILPNNYHMEAEELADLMNRLRNYFAVRSN